MQNALLAALVLLTVFGAGTVDAAEVFIKKNKTTTSAPQKQSVQPAPQGGVQNQNPQQEQVLPPGVNLYPPGVVPLTQQPCTEQDKKLVLALDKKITMKRDPNATSAQISAEAKQWNDNFSTPESMQNFINIYTRCSAVVAARREAEGIKAAKPVEAVKLPGPVKTP
ncbi:MAG: hypothetical protein DYH13_09865 [Alphaproteobacteria bacterium PRO2]|nr:hypothetical protein [Alphaproteobacteria bacterium PRO2]